MQIILHVPVHYWFGTSCFCFWNVTDQPVCILFSLFAVFYLLDQDSVRKSNELLSCLPSSSLSILEPQFGIWNFSSLITAAFIIVGFPTSSPTVNLSIATLEPTWPSRLGSLWPQTDPCRRFDLICQVLVRIFFLTCGTAFTTGRFFEILSRFSEISASIIRYWPILPCLLISYIIVTFLWPFWGLPAQSIAVFRISHSVGLFFTLSSLAPFPLPFNSHPVSTHLAAFIPAFTPQCPFF